jgi:hypothetical protein
MDINKRGRVPLNKLHVAGLLVCHLDTRHPGEDSHNMVRRVAD